MMMHMVGSFNELPTVTLVFERRSIQRKPHAGRSQGEARAREKHFVGICKL